MKNQIIQVEAVLANKGYGIYRTTRNNWILSWYGEDALRVNLTFETGGFIRDGEEPKRYGEWGVTIYTGEYLTDPVFYSPLEKFERRFIEWCNK